MRAPPQELYFDAAARRMPAEPLGAMPKESPAEADGNCLFGVVVCEYPRGHESLSTRSFVTYMRLHRDALKQSNFGFVETPQNLFLAFR